MVGSLESRCWQGYAPSVTCGEKPSLPHPNIPRLVAIYSLCFDSHLCLVQTCKITRTPILLAWGLYKHILTFCAKPLFSNKLSFIDSVRGLGLQWAIWMDTNQYIILGNDKTNMHGYTVVTRIHHGEEMTWMEEYYGLRKKMLRFHELGTREMVATLRQPRPTCPWLWSSSTCLFSWVPV